MIFLCKFDIVEENFILIFAFINVLHIILVFPIIFLWNDFHSETFSHTKYYVLSYSKNVASTPPYRVLW